MKADKKAQYCIRDEYIDRSVTKKEFLRWSKEEATKGTVSQQQLIKSKTFTKSQIEKLIRHKVLAPSKYQSVVYFKVGDVKNGIKYLSGPPKLLWYYQHYERDPIYLSSNTIIVCVYYGPDCGCWVYLTIYYAGYFQWEMGAQI